MDNVTKPSSGSLPIAEPVERVRVLLVEDRPTDAQLLQRMLTRAQGGSFELVCVGRLDAALECVRTGWPDVVLLDLSLPDSQGLSGLMRLRTAAPLLPVIVLTGSSQMDLARDAFRAGVKDYIVKDDLTPAVLLRCLRYALEHQALQDSLRQTEADLRAVLDATPDAVFQLGDDGTVELLNADEPHPADLVSLTRLEHIVSSDDADAIMSQLRKGIGSSQRISRVCEVSSPGAGPERAELRAARHGGSTIVILRRAERP